MLLQKTVTLGSSSGQTGLGSGAFTQEFGEFVNIVSALVTIANPFKSSYEVACSWAITNNNTLVVTVDKENIGSPGAWVNATTSDVQGCICTMTVDGE
jgi:hypothetical protein